MKIRFWFLSLTQNGKIFWTVLVLPIISNVFCIISRWKKVEDKLFGTDDIPIAILKGGKLRDKDKQVIKDKFSVSDTHQQHLPLCNSQFHSNQ